MKKYNVKDLEYTFKEGVYTFFKNNKEVTLTTQEYYELTKDVSILEFDKIVDIIREHINNLIITNQRSE